jgi:protein gp37
MAKRLKAMGSKNYANGFEVTLQPHMLEIPLHWKRPRNIFVNSMSDLFHEKVPLEYIQEVFAVMAKAHWHRFQVLTKRTKRLVEVSGQLEWSKNIWMGVSVEDHYVMDRIGDLKSVPAAIRFLSLEPLIGPVPDIILQGIDWVIVGGESGPGARPMKEEWVTSIYKATRASNVPFFFKQWGGPNKKRTGREFRGCTWNEMPALDRDKR